MVAVGSAERAILQSHFWLASGCRRPGSVRVKSFLAVPAPHTQDRIILAFNQTAQGDLTSVLRSQADCKAFIDCVCSEDEPKVRCWRGESSGMPIYPLVRASTARSSPPIAVLEGRLLDRCSQTRRAIMTQHLHGFALGVRYHNACPSLKAPAAQHFTSTCERSFPVRRS